MVESRADSATGTGVVALPNVVQTDAAINPGNSDGPLVDERKRLVGINTLGSPEAENQGYAIGLDRAREVLETLRKGESLAWTGAAFTPLSDAASGEGGGLLLAAAAPDTAAADSGLGEELKPLTAVDGPGDRAECRRLLRGDWRRRQWRAGEPDGAGREPQLLRRVSVEGATPEEIEVTLE